ncbi:pirin family protein [Ruicaihuangia caeni]|uniref:Pirin family protein n=1 Tax=Ruicaihuangia caeni TaxID=3042517 RepID=A0AAW6T835_9MICO|nr:pirin family protein [Klugiella sp. YN-L-19]MDI2098464.1 pirin family protein [Klugiella sp. YN-L-19]
MSNLEIAPSETVCEAGAASTAVEPVIEIIEPREVPLGGPRAMEVRRTLPQKARSLIGAWCFADHYGPDPAGPRRMDVPPHPHTGLQTVTWLFAGEIEHHDSSGGHAMVRPGQLNLMTAGRGVQHSEVSTAAQGVLHGVQLWTALPDHARHGRAFFEHSEPPVLDHQGARVSVFLGSLLGYTAEATTFTPLVGAQLDLPAGVSVELPVDERFEHGVLVDAGEISFEGTPVPRASLGYRAPGATTLSIANTGDSLGRVVLIGGEPFGEQIVMWWNFIGRTHDEVVAFREQWQREVIDGETDAGRFGRVEGYVGRDGATGKALPAPALPNVRLRPRG